MSRAPGYSKRFLRSIKSQIYSSRNNLSPFDSNIAWLCQSTEINNNKHGYRQSRMQKPIGDGIEWAECSLIIRMGCSSFWLDPRYRSRFVSGHSAWWRFGVWDYIQQRKTTCLLSIRISLACSRASKFTTTNMYVCMHVCMHASGK